MKWNDDKTITITPPAKPKKITGTRFAAIMGLNKWTSPFNAWCAITRTYEEPFEDTIYTIAGKTIEPKQAEYPAVDCGKCGIIDREGICHPKEHDCSEFACYAVGENDLSLMKKLAAAGNDHGKFLRMINVTVDVEAPLYWWKEFDTYKVGTVANSCSTMHKIQAKEFTLEDFSTDHLSQTNLIIMKMVVDALNNARLDFLSQKDNRCTTNPARTDFIKKVQKVCALYREGLMQDGKVNPVTGIFWQKNYDGMKDQTEMVLTPNNPLGDSADTEALARKYLDNADIVDMPEGEISEVAERAESPKIK